MSLPHALQFRISRIATRLMLLGIAVCLFNTMNCAGGDLEKVWNSPPQDAKPWVYWFWMNGNITKEGITADLEAMHRVGIGGTLIMSVSTGIPPGKVDFMSAEWREMFKHAIREADRLGLQVIMNNDDGWTGSGGPWNKVEDSMQMLTSSELRVTGPKKFNGVLPQPVAKGGYYKDIALFAIPLPADAIPAQATASDPACEVAALIDGDAATVARLPAPSPAVPQWVQLDYEKPFAARSLTMKMAPRQGSFEAELQVSDDGKTFRTIAPLKTLAGRDVAASVSLSFDPLDSHHYRIVFTTKGRRAARIGVADLELRSEPATENLTVQAVVSSAQSDDSKKIAPPAHPQKDPIIDLTSKLAADGCLAWDVPAGNWTLLRLGHTTNGAKNHPSTPLGSGYECDKLAKEPLDKHYAGFLEKLISDVGPLAGKSLVGTHIDSWEVGQQYWTPKFREEFQTLRGYDPLPYLPVLAGRVVDRPAIAERFLHDYHRTIANLMADNHFSHLRALAQKHGMGLSVEAYGSNFNYVQCGARADIPMAEFWVNTRPFWIESIKGPASSGHVAGRKIIAAEAFTSFAPSARWQNHPYTLKPIGDLAFAKGINRFVFHRWAMQPWLDRLPGMTFGEYGTHYERTITWFEQSRAWIDYLRRCQALLQEGKFVADVCYFIGQNEPARLASSDNLDPKMPPGYDYDGCDEETILHRMTVKDRRIVLPDGMSYKLLVLPESRTVTPELLAKLKQMVDEGANITGPKPETSPSLTNYPQCDEQVAKLADELWGDTSTPGEKSVGLGKVSWGKPLDEILKSLDLPQDVVFGGLENTEIPWIHRRADQSDVYFISNQGQFATRFDATFRVAGKMPELWDAVTGKIEQAGVWQPTADGRTTVRFPLEPYGSVFVVFRKPAAGADTIADVSRDGKSLTSTTRLANVVVHKAVYGLPNDPKSLIDVTDKVQAIVDTPNRAIRVWVSGPGNVATNIPRSIVADFSVNGRRMTLSAKGQQDLMLPFFDEPERLEAVVKSIDGRPCLLVSKPGDYQLTTAAGKKLLLSVPEVPADAAIGGPWKLRFPAGWDAPESLTLDKLISWTEHADEGVKYFSGTATYEKTFEITADKLGKDKQLFLDLGRVSVIAEVKLNGVDLGILWKPPFRVSIGDVAKAGENRLEIRVTNLWPNRLIGDEKKPPYLKFDLKSERGGHPIEWPDWVATGGPVPKTGRLTFTTWHHYDKDSPLLQSGLLGPVTLQSVRIVPCGESPGSGAFFPRLNKAFLRFSWVGEWAMPRFLGS